MTHHPKTLLALASAYALCLLAGCATSFNPTFSPAESPVGTLHGSLYGGQQGVSGSHVYVMQVATTGYGAPSTSLITSGYAGTDAIGHYVLTDQYGSFGITGDYTCTSGSQVYLLAEQGNPGLTGSPTPNNSAIALMAAVGACPSTGTLAATVPYVTINEVSTIVAAYALAGFATDATHIASSGTALATVGLNNAAAMVPNLMNVGTGVALTATAATSSTAPRQEINTLANILASCINSSGPTQGGCPTLFADATATGVSTGTQPTETATAAINIAHFPAEALPTGGNTLYSLQGSTPPFAPNLTTAPADYTIKLYYPGGGLNQSAQVAVDGSGNIWVSSRGNNTLNKFSPLGVPLSGTTGFTGGGLNSPNGVAIDASGNAWVANFSGANVSKFNASGVTLAGTTGYIGNGDLAPAGIAIDTTGSVWVTNIFNATVSKLSNTGTETLNTNGGNAFSGPSGIAIDATNQVWVSDENNLVAFILNNSTGTVNSSFACNDNCYSLSLTSGSSPFAWVTELDTTLSKGTPNGGTATSYTGGGLRTSLFNVLDGAGNIWVTNQNNEVSEFNSAGTAITPSTGYVSTLGQTSGIAVDGSGNVWVTDSAGNKLLEIVGAATPTVTPLVRAVINNNIAGRP